LQSVKRQRDYLGYRTSTPEPASSGNSMPTLIGAAMIAAAILLSTLISSVGSRYVGIESPTDESAWLVDRLTGTVYKCQAAHAGRASCEADIATGSVGERQKRREEGSP
jgi:hypothetical protein